LPSPTVLYDACVLYPAPLRDFLIELATANLFQARWTNAIHDEWIRNLLINRPDLKLEQLQRTRQLMDRSVMDCMIKGYEHLIPAISLPDRDDRHIVAAAIHAKADTIVTLNLKDFPEAELSKYNLDAIHPDEFISRQFELNASSVVIAAQRCHGRLKNPPKSAEEYLDALLTQSLPKTVAALRPYSPIL
jgi:predicted nucleic acid-binding protein